MLMAVVWTDRGCPSRKPGERVVHGRGECAFMFISQSVRSLQNRTIRLLPSPMTVQICPSCWAMTLSLLKSSKEGEKNRLLSSHWTRKTKQIKSLRCWSPLAGGAPSRGNTVCHFQSNPQKSWQTTGIPWKSLATLRINLMISFIQWNSDFRCSFMKTWQWRSLWAERPSSP